MRASVIFGLGASPTELKPFQASSTTEWLQGLPASSSDADAILIFGGDGTIHRHLPALVRLQLPVLIVPAGSGNDFARALHLRSVRDSWRVWTPFQVPGHSVRRSLPRYCYTTGDGLQNPTLRVHPGDWLIIHFQNDLAPIGDASEPMPVGAIEVLPRGIGTETTLSASPHSLDVTSPVTVTARVSSQRPRGKGTEATVRRGRRLIRECRRVRARSPGPFHPGIRRKLRPSIAALSGSNPPLRQPAIQAGLVYPRRHRSPRRAHVPSG